ncbi:MAG TPA: SDR family oxidoreductase [Caldilineaceae bacterium]|nr:SDR family oxidoreductase [Caldilineaceae bacterium]
MTTLIVGATGLVGGEICRLLTSQGQRVRALVRKSADSAKIETLTKLGCALAYGDLCNPASLAAACQGVEAVIATASSMPFAYKPGENDIATTDRQGMLDLVDAAKAAGVRHFIYTSISANMNLPFPTGNAKREVEQHLIGSGMTYTILRPGYFMEVWLSPAVGFDAANGQAVIYGSGTQPISWIAAPDVARFAVASLTNPAAANAILELGGPAALSPLQVVAIYEEISGRTIALTYVSAEELAAQQAAATDPMQQSFAALMRCFAAGDPIDMTATLVAFPLPLTSVKEFVRKQLVSV